MNRTTFPMSLKYFMNKPAPNQPLDAFYAYVHRKVNFPKRVGNFGILSSTELTPRLLCSLTDHPLDDTQRLIALYFYSAVNLMRNKLSQNKRNAGTQVITFIVHAMCYMQCISTMKPSNFISQFASLQIRCQIILFQKPNPHFCTKCQCFLIFFFFFFKIKL